MFDAKKLLNDLLGSQVPGAGGTLRDRAGQLTQMAKDNPGKTAALAGLLVGTKTGRSIGTTAVQLGGMAAIAGLAYKAFQQYQSSRQTDQTGQQVEPATASTQPGEPLLLPAPEQSPFHPSQIPGGEDSFALLLIRGMIAAARADGTVDAQEREQILGRVKDTNASADAIQFLDAELSKPVDIDGLVAGATSEEQKIELYTASLLAIDADTRSERLYLDLLADRLNLPEALASEIQATVEKIKVAA